jgi:hypothetical protein
MGYVGTSNGITGVGFTGTTSIPPGLDTSFSNRAYNECLERLYDKIRGNLDLSIDLLQHRQTAATVSRASKILKSFGAEIVPMILNPRKASADVWLEWTYGIKPTMSSIYDTLMLFQQGNPLGDFQVVVRANDRRWESESWVGVGDTYIPTRCNYYSSKRCKIGLNLRINPSILGNFAGVTSLNPISIAWELVPYSFVLDWVYNVGGYLRSFESAFLYRSAFRNGYVTQTFKASGETYTTGSYSDKGGIWKSIATNGQFSHIKMQRTVLNSMPLPRPPSLKLDLGSGRILNAVALLQQLIR